MCADCRLSERYISQNSIRECMPPEARERSMIDHIWTTPKPGGTKMCSRCGVVYAYAMKDEISCVIVDSQVDHPTHYGGADNPYEVIKVLEHFLTQEEFRGFCKGNVHKYLARANRKGGSEDAAKASWYAAYLVDYEKRIANK